MRQYFKSLEAVAASDSREFNDIYDLTVAVAKESGYSRQFKVKKDGSLSKFCPSTYAQWNNALVAKWLLYYKNLFISTLSKHPKLEEYYYDIIERTFTYFFKALDLNILKFAGQVTKLFRAQLNARIREALYVYGTEGRFERTKTGDKSGPMMHKNMTQYASLSMDQLAEDNAIQFSDETVNNDMDDLIIAINKKFETPIFSKAALDNLTDNQKRQLAFIKLRNELGKKLLQAFLTNKKRVSLSKITDIIKIDDKNLCTATQQRFTKLSLDAAYKIIVNELKAYLNAAGVDTTKYDWNIKPKFDLTSTKAEEKINETNAIWQQRLDMGDCNCVNYAKSLSMC